MSTCLFVQRDFPTKFIYEPWKAPIDLQRRCNCIVGKDYPSPIVDHDVASKENMNRMKRAYDSLRAGDSAAIDEDISGSEILLKQKSVPSRSRKRDRDDKDESDANHITKYFK